MKLTVRNKAWKDFFLAVLKKGLSLFKQFTWCFMVLLEEQLEFADNSDTSQFFSDLLMLDYIWDGIRVEMGKTQLF